MTLHIATLLDIVQLIIQSYLISGFNSAGERHLIPFACSFSFLRCQKVWTEPTLSRRPSFFISASTSCSTSLIRPLYLGSYSFASHLLSRMKSSEPPGSKYSIYSHAISPSTSAYKTQRQI